MVIKSVKCDKMLSNQLMDYICTGGNETKCCSQGCGGGIEYIYTSALDTLDMLQLRNYY